MEKVAVCICILIASALAAAPAYFVPFGSSNGDQTLYRNDDGSSSALAFNYRFFGRTYNALYVNNNGLISFSGPVSSYTASGLAGLSYPAICPFWADVDTRPSNGGYVYYRSTTNAAQLNQVSEFIRQTRSPTFVGVRMFVVTWDSVGYYSNHVEKLNTFQAVLIADEGDFSFVVFNYGDIKWVTGDASGGSGGFGGTGAAVGFGSGSSTNYAQVDGSLTNTIVSVNTRSNVQYAGRYVYQVNEGVVINRCCDTSSPPVLTPVTSMVLSCTDAIPAAPTVTATFSCTTPATSTVPVVETVSINGCNKVITRTWTATDSCLRSSRVVQTITVTDRDAPILTLPSADRNVVSCTSSTSPSVTGFATATDACSANVQVTYSDAAPTATATCSADNNNIRSSFIRTWTATDSCGNSVSEGQVIQIQDINAPVYDSSFRSTVTFECGATSGIDSTSSSVSDCNTFTESKVDVVSSSNCMSIASIQREYTLTDSCGNSRSYPQQITIQDTIAPTVVSEDSCIFPLNRKYACFDLSAPFFVQGSDQCSSNLRYNYAGNCVDNLGRRKYCVVHENQLCMKAAPGIESYTLSYLVTDECGHSTPTSATFHLGSGVNCRVPDTRVIDSCDGAADDFADAEVSIDQVSIDLWGGQDAPQQYRVSATVTFATPLQDWRVVVVLPSDTDSVVHYGEYYSVYNGEVFVCEDEGVFTVKPAGDWVRGQSSVVFEYVVSNTQGYSEADIRSLTEFAVFTTI